MKNILHWGHSFIFIFIFVHFPPQKSVFTHLLTLGPELYQDQEMLGLAIPALGSKKLWSSSCYLDIEAFPIFHKYSICKENYVVFYFAKKFGRLPF